jgi:hypothetical protein
MIYVAKRSYDTHNSELPSEDAVERGDGRYVERGKRGSSLETEEGSI